MNTNRFISSAVLAVLTLWTQAVQAQTTQSVGRPRPAESPRRDATAAPGTTDSAAVRSGWYVGPRVSTSSMIGVGVEMITGGPAARGPLNGRIGLGAAVDYYSVGFLGERLRITPVSAFANYHFAIPDLPKLDPFVGAGLGFAIASYQSSEVGYSGSASTGLFLVGQAGARYFISERIAAQAQVGAGLGTLSAGLTVRF